jgi:RNase P subunit RPR2
MFEPGEWYLVVNCHNCKTMLKLFRDPDNRIFSPSGDYILTCPGCNHKGSYSMDQVERYQHPAEEQDSVE